MSRPYATILLMVGVMAAGCGPENGSQVMERLPSPWVHTRSRVEPSPTPPPAPGPAPTKSIARRRIVVDAGHGGKDPGAMPGTSNLPEKTIVLSIANEVARQLKQRGANVTQTRTTDRFIELDDRAAVADRTKTDLFVSIHADSAGRASATGTGLYIATNATSQSQRAAMRLQAAFERAGINCRGIQRKRYRVLVGHARPAVLVECGFLTNPGDAQRLNSAWYRKKLAGVIAEGIADHFSR